MSGRPDEPFTRHDALRGADDASPALEGLLHDIVAMSLDAAEQGLPISTLIDDVRLVCDVPSAAPLPVDVLRLAVLTWSDAQSAAASAHTADRLIADDPDELLAALLGAAGERASTAVALAAQADGPAPPALRELARAAQAAFTRAGGDPPLTALVAPRGVLVVPLDELDATVHLAALHRVLPGLEHAPRVTWQRDVTWPDGADAVLAVQGLLDELRSAAG